jgi:hypothetical protein
MMMPSQGIFVVSMQSRCSPYQKTVASQSGSEVVYILTILYIVCSISSNQPLLVGVYTFTDPLSTLFQEQPLNLLWWCGLNSKFLGQRCFKLNYPKVYFFSVVHRSQSCDKLTSYCMAIAIPLSFMMLPSIDTLRGFIVSLRIWPVSNDSDRHVS